MLTEIYPAGEDPVADVSGETLFHALTRRGHADVRFAPQRAALAEAVHGVCRPGDVVLTLGAGDVTRTGPELLARLRDGGVHAG